MEGIVGDGVHGNNFWSADYVYIIRSSATKKSTRKIYFLNFNITNPLVCWVIIIYSR